MMKVGMNSQLRFQFRRTVTGALGALLISSFAVAQAGPAQVGTHHAAKKAAKKAVPAPLPEATVVVELSLAPPPPPTPGEVAPNAPVVSYEDGQLTILAENSTLASILTAVGSATGSSMDVPAGTGSDRVWISLGPGPARAVLAALLVGTDLDYVIQAADEDSTRIQSVLLSPRSKGRPGDTSGPGNQTVASRIAERLRPHTFGTQESSDADSTASAPENTADASAASPTGSPAASPTAQAETPAVPGSASPSDTPNPALTARLPLNVSESDAHPAPVANTEQAIPQMQNLFELRRQLQAQENAKQKLGAR